MLVTSSGFLSVTQMWSKALSSITFVKECWLETKTIEIENGKFVIMDYSKILLSFIEFFS